uniref:Chitin binding beak protein 4 n=1 Tax=Dosidicus gigas TaxID=346249 RepID=A0A0G2UQ39_DOSGI|nr:chitin binding beak protein 4 [Dosidicus gigas]
MFLYATCVFLAAGLVLSTAQIATNPCEVAGVHTQLMADPTSCSNFFFCVGKIPRRMECGPGTLFNARIKMCDHAENVNCDDTKRPIVPPTKPSPSVRPTVPIHDTKLVEQYYERWYKFYCSEYGSNNVVRWPHPNKCDRFYECRQQKLSAVVCPTYPQQMLYNRTLQNCDLPQRVRCEKSLPFGNNFASASEEELKYRALCKPGTMSFNRWANSHDCRRFYQCLNGQFTKENCSIRPQQLVYNVTTRNCQKPAYGDLCVLNWVP